MKSTLPFLFAAVLKAMVAAPAIASPSPSDFRTFSDKLDRQIEAQAISISEDWSTVRIRTKEGQEFDLEATRLSLDDQQFLKDWLDPRMDIPAGRLRVFGKRPDGTAVDGDLAEEYEDFVEVYALKSGWLGKRRKGEVIASAEQFQGLGKPTDLYCNTIWSSFIRADGTVWRNAERMISPESLPPAVKSSVGGGSSAVILEDGRVKLWGGRTKSDEPVDPPSPIANAIDLAATQGFVAALINDGTVRCWKYGETGVETFVLDDEIVDIEGSIFNILALSRGGRVFQWGKADPSAVKTPRALQDESGKLQVTKGPSAASRLFTFKTTLEKENSDSVDLLLEQVQERYGATRSGGRLVNRFENHPTFLAVKKDLETLSGSGGSLSYGKLRESLESLEMMERIGEPETLEHAMARDALEDYGALATLFEQRVDSLERDLGDGTKANAPMVLKGMLRELERLARYFPESGGGDRWNAAHASINESLSRLREAAGEDRFDEVHEQAFREAWAVRQDTVDSLAAAFRRTEAATGLALVSRTVGGLLAEFDQVSPTCNLSDNLAIGREIARQGILHTSDSSLSAAAKTCRAARDLVRSLVDDSAGLDDLARGLVDGATLLYERAGKSPGGVNMKDTPWHVVEGVSGIISGEVVNALSALSSDDFTRVVEQFDDTAASLPVAQRDMIELAILSARLERGELTRDEVGGRLTELAVAAQETAQEAVNADRRPASDEDKAAFQHFVAVRGAVGRFIEVWRKEAGELGNASNRKMLEVQLKGVQTNLEQARKKLNNDAEIKKLERQVKSLERKIEALEEDGMSDELRSRADDANRRAKELGQKVGRRFAEFSYVGDKQETITRMFVGSPMSRFLQQVAIRPEMLTPPPKD